MRRYKIWSILAVVLLLLFLTAEVVPVYASLLDEKQQLEQEKKGVHRQLERERSNLKQQRSREAELEDELKQLDRRLQELQSKLEQINREIAAAEEKIVRAEEALTEAEAEFAEKETLFKRRLRNIYERGYVSYLDVLLGASSFSDFLTRFNNLKIIADNDQRLVEEVRAERDRVEAMKEALEQEKNRLEGMRRQILDDEAELERTVASRKMVMEELQEEIARNVEAIRVFEQTAHKLSQEIQALTEKSSGGGGSGVSGKFCWPAEDSYRVTSEFGRRLHPTRNVWHFHTGIDIGTTGFIRAAETGQVVLARLGWNGGYGNYIVIDHRNGITTLYAHLSVISVSAGQSVSRGQRIGIAGNTGVSTGIHLHFEVREQGELKNPMNYF